MLPFFFEAAFISPRVRLTASELRAGLENELISESVVIDLELALLEGGVQLSDWEEELAILLKDETSRVVAILDRASRPPENDEAVWLYLSLSWLRKNEPSGSILREKIDFLYADFGYPDEIAPMVTYMPDQGEYKENTIEGRLAAYLSTRGTYYSRRNGPPAGGDGEL